MTELQIRKNVIETATSYFGSVEGSPNHKEIIDTYNAHKPLARGYKVTYTDAWCATFVSFVGIVCGLTDIMPTECGCGQMIELYRKRGRWQENDAYTPEIGDIIMFDWDDNGNGDTTGWPEHVGFVSAVTGSSLTIIEGNKNNSVGYRSINVNSRYIRGYCLPDYASKATETVSGSAPVEKTEPEIDHATQFSADVAGTYKCTASILNVRSGAGTSKRILTTIVHGTKVQNYGYFTTFNGVKWLVVQFKQNGKTITGYASSKYLKK